MTATETQTTRDAVRWTALQRRVQGEKLASAFRLFRSHSIEPVLIKGFAAGEYYPPDVVRHSIDMDLAVAAKDFDKATAIAASPEAEGLAIDLHRELRHLDTLAWNDLIDNTILINAADEQIRVLRPEDHLRVLAVHWLNDGGRDREKLRDIHYLIASRGPEFDWTRALDTVSPRRRRWIVCTILLAGQEFGTDLSGTPIEAEQGSLPAWLRDRVRHAWQTPRTETPLWLLTRQPVEFVRELSTRLVPDPVRATVEMEGDIDTNKRAFYRIGNFFQRLVPSVRRAFEKK